MDNIQRALDVQRTSFSRIYTFKDILAVPDYSMSEVEGSVRMLDKKMEALDELDKLLLDFLLNSDASKEDIDKEVKIADEYSSSYHQLKAEIDRRLHSSRDETASCSGNSNLDRLKSRLKLPKIEFIKFSGEPKNWLPFWCQFRRIHEDNSIEIEDKFQYLLQFTTPKSRPRLLVESYPPTRENYLKVIESLKSRFGRKDLLIEVYVREILKLVLSTNISHKRSLSSLYDQLESHLRALETFDIKSDACAAMIYPLVESCLDDDLIKTWQRCPSYDEESTMQGRLNNLMRFLEKEVRREEKLLLATSRFDLQNKNKAKLSNTPATASDLINKSYIKCIFCQKSHESKDCTFASSLSLPEKKLKLTTNGRCYICLKFGHTARNCRVKVRCTSCQGKHYSIMCPKAEGESQLKLSQKPVKHDTPEEMSLSNVTYTEVFLQTLAVCVIGEDVSRRARLIIDTGSQKSYILKSTALEMGYKQLHEEELIHSLFGGSQSEAVKHSCYKVGLCNLDHSYACNFNVLDQNIICHNISSITKGPWSNELNKLGVNLTDTREGVVEILIGADIAGKLFTGKKYDLECGLVVMQTVLGWILMGKSSFPQHITRSNFTTSTVSMFLKDSTLSEMWKLDVLGITNPSDRMSRQEKENEVMNHFLETISRHEDGRYKVCMPFVEGHACLSTNFDMAHRRLLNLIKRLHDDGYYDDYQQQLNDWLEEGIIEEVSEENYRFNGHYLPHRHVVKLSSATTKIHPVFDASAREKNCPSLNQCLEKGVNFLELIPSILLRFRTSRFGVVADIRKAFLQTSLQENDKRLFKISVATLELIRSHQSLYSENIVLKLIKGFYVDNCILSVDSEEEVRQVIKQSTAILEEAKFDLRVWEHTIFDINILESSLTPVLGLIWNRNLDSFELSLDWVNKINVSVITKRVILSIVNKIFDPIGFSCPISLYPKLLLQKTWTSKIGWDVEVEDDFRVGFLNWVNQLSWLVNLKIPRWLFTSVTVFNLTLHVFNDASKDAYATSIFLRSESSLGVNVQFVQAKSRLCPLKSLSIPRLELLSATIGARLAKTILENFDHDVKVFYWSDSSTVLTWIKDDDQWKPFVWNRVSEIRRLTNKSDWYHVPGHLNAADLPSRGCSPKKLIESKWWEGPNWLLKPSTDWPSQDYVTNEVLVNSEKKSRVVSAMVNAVEYSWYYSYFSNYNKIVRMVAWVKRFLNNIREKDKMKRIKAGLSSQEIEFAENMIIRLIQEESFQGCKDSRLSSMLVFLDSQGIIRMKSKVSYMEDSLSFRLPCILPSNHVMVHRLISYEHVKNLHAGVQFIMSKLRERFWILRCRQTVKSVISKCRICRRYNGRRLQVQSSPLPVDRVRDASVFEVIGIDLTGPLYIRSEKKVWFIIFTCAIFRAVHIELVSSLSSDDFILSFRRFIARRGRPSVVYSDNANNFLSTQNLSNKVNWKMVEEDSHLERICWKRIPPTAPWWGGFWERLLRILKDLLRKVLKRSCVTYDELSTVLCDCEAIINSRPLTYLTQDDQDMATLTPAMFLQEIKEVGVVDLDNIEKTSMNRRMRYRLKLKEDLRKRFRKEYLGQLCQSKRSGTSSELQVGDIVIVEHDNQKRLDWPLGRIEKLIVGRDGKVRVVELKTATGHLLRPVQRLYPLEMEGDIEILKKVESKKEDHSDTTEYVTRSGRISKPPTRLIYN